MVHLCADGRKQQLHMSEEEGVSLIVLLESFFITKTIEVKEKRSAIKMDLTGEFFHARSNDDIFRTKTEKTEDLIVMIAPQIYQKYIRHRKR